MDENTKAKETLNKAIYLHCTDWSGTMETEHLMREDLKLKNINVSVMYSTFQRD
jgi:hypothetical protein